MARDIPPEVVQSPGVNPTARPTPHAEARALAQVQVQLPTTSQAKTRARRLHARAPLIVWSWRDAFHGVRVGSGWNPTLQTVLGRDICRLRRPKALRRMGMFRRFSNSLLECRRRQKQPPPQTTTGFFGAVNAEQHRYAIGCLLPRQPSLQTPSCIGRA